MAKKDGKVVNKFPPNNDGSSQGAGEIEETVEGIGQGRPYFVFHTPNDNNGVALPDGTKVRFEADGQKATNVEKAVSDEPLG